MPKPFRVFVSYSQEDDDQRTCLVKHLSLLERQGVIELWFDRMILPGETRDRAVARELDKADIFLLLVSADFSHSEPCTAEMNHALTRREDGKALVVPVIVRACDWHIAPFHGLVVLPEDRRAVTSWPNEDEAWTDVAKNFRRLLDSFSPSRSREVPEGLPSAMDSGDARLLKKAPASFDLPVEQQVVAVQPRGLLASGTANTHVPLSSRQVRRETSEGLGKSESLSFGFENLARTLVVLARDSSNPTPFSLVIRGGPGSGKTALLRRAQRLLQDEGEKAGDRRRVVKTLWFNPWKYPAGDQVLAGLLGTLMGQLLQEGLGNNLRTYVGSRRDSVIRAVLAAASPLGVKELLNVELKDQYRDALGKRAFYDNFGQLFSEISRLLFAPKIAFRDTGGIADEYLWSPERQENEVLAIFLDDLDRCRPDRVSELLEVLNLHLDIPGVCFFLGVDWNRLMRRLPADLLEQGDVKQEMERVFTKVVFIPEVSAAEAGEFLAHKVKGTVLESAFVARLEKGEAPTGQLVEEATAVARLLASRSPRHLKRFQDDLSMSLSILASSRRLGSGPYQVPARAALGWWLLEETLQVHTWNEIRSATGQARLYLRLRLAALAGEGLEEVVRDDFPGGREGARTPRLHRFELQGDLVPFLKLLYDLNDSQLQLLAHPVSQPAMESDQQEAVLFSGLLDIGSGCWVRLGTLEPFFMGADDGRENERPVHPVTLSPYWMARFPVTNVDYALYVQEVGKSLPKHWVNEEIPIGKERHPVVNVSWQDAEAYCSWLTRKLNGKGFEGSVLLPTEAQWEFAARGSERREYPWGNEPTPSAELANFDMQIGETTPVGSYPRGATPDGVQDLAGNVLEWCRDRYGDSYREQPSHDPTGPEVGPSRVLRGGSFFDHARWLHGAHRFSGRPRDRGGAVGFRVVFY